MRIAFQLAAVLEDESLVGVQRECIAVFVNETQMDEAILMRVTG